MAHILAAFLWDEIERIEDKDFRQFLRAVYGRALPNGPFAVIAAHNQAMVGLNDRIGSRPLVAAEWRENPHVASEESAIWEVCPDPEQVWSPEAGEPMIGYLR